MGRGLYGTGEDEQKPRGLYGTRSKVTGLDGASGNTPAPGNVSQQGLAALTTLPGPMRYAMDTIGANVTQGKPYSGGGAPAIASVGDHDPTTIEVNDPTKFAKDPSQVVAHEATHLWQNNLPPSIQAKIPADSDTDPYDISNVDALRKQGHTLATIPREQAATIVQQYMSRPQERKRLQPWIDDMGKIPLSSTMPTEPNATRLNMKPRPPSPPLMTYK
jgi:hypothetical protein